MGSLEIFDEFLGVLDCFYWCGLIDSDIYVLLWKVISVDYFFFMIFFLVRF